MVLGAQAASLASLTRTFPSRDLLTSRNPIRRYNVYSGMLSLRHAEGSPCKSTIVTCSMLFRIVHYVLPHASYLTPAAPTQCYSTEGPHLLQMLDDQHVGIHVSIHAVLHARLLVAVQGALGDLAGDAFVEAGRVERVDGWRNNQYWSP